MPATRPREADPDTRCRLLEAAADVFTEQGYRCATVRDICARAGANVAAVNYHFGGKQELYVALLEHLGRQAVQRYPPDLGLAQDANAEQRLFAFIHSFLLRILSDDALGQHGCIVAREMVEPTGALDRLVEEVIRPLFLRLRGIVAEILGPGATPDEVILGARSVVGQCLFYHHARPVIARLTPGEKLTPARIRTIAEHVTRFSLEGLRIRRPQRGPGARSSSRRRQ